MAASAKSAQKEKEMAAMVDGVYKSVIDDVINGVRADFQSDGVDESCLQELHSIWMLKLLQHPGALVSSTMIEPWLASKTDPPIVDHGAARTDTSTSTPGTTQAGSPPARDLTDLNVAYTPIDEYETPTVELLFPETPMQVTDDEPVMKDFLSSGSNEVSYHENGLENGLENGRGSFLKPSTWLQPPKPLVDMNVEYRQGQEDEHNNGSQEAFPKDFFTLSTGKRKREELPPADYFTGKHILQQDGSGELALGSPSSATVAPRNQETTRWTAERSSGKGADFWSWPQTTSHSDSQITELLDAKQTRKSLDIPQLDGNEDTFNDVAEEDYNEPDEEEGVAGEAETKVEGEAGTESNASEPPLNDADDDPDEDSQGSEELKAEHLVLAQFEKVSRTRNKWKCILKDGIMHLNNRDILFQKATGEFEF